MSPISSRNSVPPSAVSKVPRLRAAAPVNAPFSCPNSSLSSSVSVRAAHETATNGARWRGLRAWMARASSSLPVPLSPRIRIVDWLRAAVFASSNTACIGALLLTMSRNW